MKPGTSIAQASILIIGIVLTNVWRLSYLRNSSNWREFMRIFKTIS
ncbi:hypothetical protein HanIR_Chr11g0523321 [Helianthus annuus]|nr:hypothetical protein HanIR_Chr11g0523321 [Helianthus annuus]